jgi:hypothetical protein
MTVEEYNAGLAYASIFPYYDTVIPTINDRYSGHDSLLMKLKHMYERQYSKKTALYYAILYLTFAEPSFVENAKQVYIRLSDSEILMFENTDKRRHSLYINALSLESHAHTLKFTIDHVYFQEHGHANTVTHRTYKLCRILPTLAVIVGAACLWK